MIHPLFFYFQSRETEMGDRVWQVQKELEELQARAHGDSEVEYFILSMPYSIFSMLRLIND